LSSQLSSRLWVERFGSYRVMLTGLTFSTLGMLWLTQLGEHSGYLSLVGPLVVFGFGNGTAFVPLTTAALDGVDAADAGAASGLVNVMQQMGGAVGLAVLVTVFGTVSKHTSVAPGMSKDEAARHVFVTAADQAFWTASAFLAATWLLVAILLRPRRPVVPDEVELDGLELATA